MRQLATHLSIAIIAIISVGCASSDGSSERTPTQPQKEIPESVENAVVGESGDTNHSNSTQADDTRSGVNDTGAQATSEPRPVESPEEALDEVDQVIAELEALEDELSALDDLLEDL